MHTATTSLYESALGAPFLQLHHLSFSSAVMSSRSSTGEEQPQRGSTTSLSTRLQEQERDEPVRGVQAQDESSFSASPMNVDKDNVGFMTKLLERQLTCPPGQPTITWRSPLRPHGGAGARGDSWTSSPPTEWRHIILLARDQDCGFRGLAATPPTDLPRRMTYHHPTSRGKKRPLY